LTIGRNGAVFAKLKQGNFGRRAQFHIMARRFFQKQPREGKQ